MPDPAQDPRSSATPNADSTTTPQQLALRLFVRIDTYSGQPPERALWRELLDLAMGTVTAFRAQNRTFKAATIHHVALALYFRANRAGIIDVPNHQLAVDCRLQRYVVTGALTVLRSIQVIRTTRTSRRAAAIHEMNAGGLSWKALRQRTAARNRKDTSPRFDFETPQALPLPTASTEPSGIRGIPLSGIRGIPPKGYVQGDTTTTCAREAETAVRPPATAAQIAFAEDLGIDHTGKDGPTLGAEIEHADADRHQDRAAAKKKRATPAAADGQQRQSPILQRRRAEAEAYARNQVPLEQSPPSDPVAAAAEQRQQALDAAAAQGWKPCPDDPENYLVRRGHRVKVNIPGLAES